jgi:hypothetical protein
VTGPGPSDLTGLDRVFAVALTIVYGLLAFTYLVEMVSKLVRGVEVADAALRVVIITFCATASWFLFENFVR